MAAASTYLQNKLLDYTLRNVSYSAPATVYMGLYTTTPTASGGTECADSNYARQSMSFNASSGGVCDTASTITFPALAANQSILGVGIFDASTSGNMLYFQGITQVDFLAGQAPQVDAGDLTVTMV